MGLSVLSTCTWGSGNAGYTMGSPDMAPAVRVGSHVSLVKLGLLRRGMVVAFLAPRHFSSSSARYFLRRIVGLPGETIEARDGRVSVNGAALAEPYLSLAAVTRSFGPVVVPTGEYFVLGDHRGRTPDSINFGPIPRSQMIGRLPG
jgi:signal peptidase I